MYPPPYNPPLPVVTPPEPLPASSLSRDQMAAALADLHTRCPCGFALPHADACAFSLDPEET